MHRQDKVVTAYENKNNPECCIMHIFEKYMGRRPFDLPCYSLHLYLQALAKVPKLPNAKWYSCQPMGIHAIQSVLSALCERAGIKGKCTNHALKATCATRMYSQDFDEQMVCEQLGNSSEAVQVYKRMNSEQKMEISQALYGNKKAKVPTSTVSKVPLEKKTLPLPVQRHDTLTINVVNLVQSTGESAQINYNYFGFDPEN